MSCLNSFTGYVPRNRIERATIAEQYGEYSRGETAVPGRDENHVTMACEAATAALGRASFTPAELGGVITASSTDPFSEHGIASHVAFRIGAPETIRTADLRGSTRAATEAIALGLDTVRARETPVLVVSADIYPATPDTPEEAEAGAGAGAILLTPETNASPVTVTDKGTATTGFVERHRRHGEPVVQGDDRFERQYGAIPAIQSALERAGSETPDYGVAVAPDNRIGEGVFDNVESHISVREAVGFAGPTSFFLDLVHCLEQAEEDTTIGAVCYGVGGADALRLDVDTVRTDGLTIEEQLANKTYVSYGRHLAYRQPAEYEGMPNP